MSHMHCNKKKKKSAQASSDTKDNSGYVATKFRPESSSHGAINE
jgi:hypothetical protein